MSGKSNSDGAYTFTKTGGAISSIDGGVAFINNALYSPSATITATQAASGNYNAGSITFNLILSSVTTWVPSLQQMISTVNGQTVYGDVYFDTTTEGQGTTKINVYSLSYSTTFTLLPGTFTIPGIPPGSGDRNTDVPAELLNLRGTLIGVIPLIKLSSNNTRTPITFAFPSNSYAISVVSFNAEYYVIPQASGDPGNRVGIYKNFDAVAEPLSYRNALVINGVYDSSGGLLYGQNSMTLRMEMKQSAYEASGIDDDTVSYAEKKIVVPLTLTKANTDIGIKLFAPAPGSTAAAAAATVYTIPGSNGAGIITREYLDGFIDLSFSQFATTDRKKLVDGTPDYGDVIYYLGLTDTRTFTFENDTVVINNNRIAFKKVTVSPIPIKFLQEETPVYKRSTQRIGETPGFVEQPAPPSPPVSDTVRTIRLQINKSTPTFIGQIPATNTADPLQVYNLPNLNKMTSEGNFVLTPPLSNNTDSSANFLFSSSNNTLLNIRTSGAATGMGTAEGVVYTAYIYGSGTATITVTQPATTNFNQKVAIFNVNIFEITPAIINCNTNLFYTNPYNREFWTRFKPDCRSSDLVDSVTGARLTATQVDEVYDMRRKAEILKYNKNVGGLTKNQKYAKASRGELMRKIGNENKYLSQASGGAGGSGGFGPFTLVCPTVPANSRVLCGLTTACGVPGKERLLCYDPSVNLYNYKRTYTYEAGLQVTLNIPTTVLTEPTNLRIMNYDGELNKVTLTWDAPNSNGGFPITGYVITYSKDNKTWEPYKSVFPYNPATAAQAAGVIAAAAATANGANAAAAAIAATTAADAVIAAGATFNPVSGEINGNSVIFERIPGSVEIRANTVYYISVFSGNVRGLSSVPATITVKTSSVPSIISNFGFTTADERQNLLVDLKWTDPVNTGTVAGSFNGPPIRQYNLYYRKIPDTTTWTKQTLDISNIIQSANNVRNYILRDLKNDSKYELKIEPINSVGIGPESAIITARTLMKPATPTGVILSAKYGLLPPVITDNSNSYINIIWNKPDTGGRHIKLYNIIITPPPSDQGVSTSVTIPYNVSTTDTRTSYSTDVGRLGTIGIDQGIYSITIAAFNGYLYSNESSPSVVTVLPRSAKPTIFAIDGTYTSSGLIYAEMIFNIQLTIEGRISLVKVNGLNSEYETYVNTTNQFFAGLMGITGEHKIRIPATSGGREIIVVGTTYSVSVTLIFTTPGQSQTSELFSYTPEIKYLTT
jgi:hypothetical protein